MVGPLLAKWRNHYVTHSFSLEELFCTPSPAWCYFFLAEAVLTTLVL